MKIVLASESAEYTAGWLKIIQARFPQLKAFIYQEGHSQPDPDITL
ncbi:MAG: hypothetical protein GX070_03325, partial [Alcaligenaceae bacterium]|nr:hypothetical protein [Alcaligenaceae bacterium]